MSTSSPFDGINYTIPETGETSWGENVSALLIALASKAATATTQRQTIRTATTSPVTVASTDYCLVCKLTVPAAVAVTLPAGTTGQLYAILDGTGDAATNNITITPNGSETINGAANYVIRTNNGSVILQYNTTLTRWVVLAAEGNVSNADVASNAAIAYSKLNLASSITSADIVDGTIVNTDINAAAAIAYSKLNLTNSIQNADIPIGQIAHNKLNGATPGQILVGSSSNILTARTVSGDITLNDTGVAAIGTGVIVDADVNAAAAIARTKVASGTASHVVINDGSGVLSSEATLANTRGGTGTGTYTTGDVLYASATDTLSKRAIGTAGQVLTVVAGVPAWTNASAGDAVLAATQTFTAVNTFSASIVTPLITSSAAQTLTSTTTQTLNAGTTFALNVANATTPVAALAFTATGLASIGPAVTNNFTGRQHILNGSLYGGNTTTTDGSGRVCVGVNVRFSAQAAETARTVGTSIGGAGIQFSPRTNNAADAIGFYVNQLVDATTTDADLAGFITQNRIWTLGNSADGIAGGATHTLYTNFDNTATAGGVHTPPATVRGYIIMNINGTNRRIPYYD